MKFKCNLFSFINKYGEELGTEKYNQMINKHKKSKIGKIGVNNLNEFIKRYGEELGTEKYNNYTESLKGNTNCGISSFINKYGEELGIEKYNQWRKNAKNKLLNFINKYGEELGTEKYNQWKEKLSINKKGRCGVGKNLNSFIERYGEELGTEKFNKYQDKVGNSLTKYILRYGEELGTEKYNDYILKMKSISFKCNLNSFIERYGEELGTENYNSWISKVHNNNHYSKISQECFWKIHKQIKDFISDDKIYFQDLNKEYYTNKNNKSYFYDFVITEPKICIEFHGDNFHGNPDLFNENDILFIGKTVKEVREYDKLKRQFIENEGFKYFIIWEKNYIDTPNEIVYIIVNKIKQLLKLEGGG